MAQWEAGIGDGSQQSAYPVLDFEDVQYIIDEESEGNLLVLCRSLEGEESIIGYSYAYLEAWESSINEPARPSLTSPRARKRRSKPDFDQSSKLHRESLYIAELFVSESERGLGLGDLLLTETLKVHSGLATASTETSRSALGSHLFVSSRNYSAVKCYSKFGFQRGLRPSGDAVHDAVMELNSCLQSLVASIDRYSQQIRNGTVGVRRRRRPLSYQNRRTEAVCSNLPSATALSTQPAPVEHNSKREILSKGSCPVDAFSRQDRGSRVKAEAKSESNFDSNMSVSPLLPVSGSPSFPLVRTTRSNSSDQCICISNICAKQGCLARAPNSEQAKLVHDLNITLFDSVSGSSARKLIRRSSRRPRFLLTGMRSSARTMAEDGIRRLGGDVLKTETYDFSCSHIIAARPIRTEKFLCGLAEGKPLLHPAYVDQSLKNGAFLGEAEFEWPSILSEAQKGGPARFSVPVLDSFGATICSSALRWRHPGLSQSSFPASRNHDSEPIPCFHGIVAILFVSNTKSAGLCRLILAGGGLVATDFRSWQQSRKPAALRDLNLTHAVVCGAMLHESVASHNDGTWSAEERLEAIRALRELQESGVFCVREEYLVDLLKDGPGLRRTDYLIDLPAETSTTAARKRARKEGAETRPLRSKINLL